MNDFVSNSLFFGVFISIAGYSLGLFLKSKIRSALCNPMLISIIFVILFLLVCDISYEAYNSSAKYLSYLLTPTTVCLAVPLYRRLSVLKQNPVAILVGLLSGVAASLLSVYLLSVILGFDRTMLATLLPKSVTTAIGMELASEIGGNGSIAAAVIVVTGVLGNIIADGVCKLFRITHPVAKGLAIGCAAHAVGSARAMELGETEGAMSSLAIAVCGLMTVVLAPIFSNFPI
ncbi:MAG: LrgB family protein [Clostridia bacterium]|nr:LrgB family protein [Clostridia bacterium]